VGQRPILSPLSRDYHHSVHSSLIIEPLSVMAFWWHRSTPVSTKAVSYSVRKHGRNSLDWPTCELGNRGTGLCLYKGRSRERGSREAVLLFYIKSASSSVFLNVNILLFCIFQDGCQLV
jgi:hypothetical protein